MIFKRTRLCNRIAFRRESASPLPGSVFGPAVIHLLSFKGEIEFWSFREYALNSLARAHCVQVTGKPYLIL